MSSGTNKTLRWINIFIARNALSDVQNKYVIMDKGGYMAIIYQVLNLLNKYNYAVNRTTPDVSYRNSLYEIPHVQIG